MKLDILLETADYIIINKQAGILTLPDRYSKIIPNYKDILVEQYGAIFIVHRLDVGTSGCLLFAKTADFHRNINIQFAEHKVQKHYLAIIEGDLRKDITVDIPLLTNKNGGVICSARGKESKTHIKIIQRYGIATLIDAQLETGRLHQLRVHCKSIGYPLLVDNIYGNRSEYFVSELKKRRYNLKKGEIEHPIITRPTMHAIKLAFTDLSEANITVEAHLPKDIKALINLLEKYSKR